MSYALECIAESKKSLVAISNTSLDILVDVVEKIDYELEARQNVALTLGHLVKNGTKLDASLIEKLSYTILAIKDENIKKSLITAIGYTIKNQEENLFSEDCILNFIKLLDAYEEDISDSARIIIDNYLQKNQYIFKGNEFLALTKVLVSNNASFNASFILKNVCDKNNKSLVQKEGLLAISKSINRI
jgi:hypothetical protein